MSSPTGSPLVQKTLEVNYINHRRRTSFKWSLINGTFFIIFAYDLSCKCPHYTTFFHIVEYGLTTVLGLNALYHIFRYLYLSFILTPVAVTPRQKKLLGFADNDTSFILTPTASPRAPSPEMDRSEPFSISSRSWMSNTSPNASRQSVTSTSWNFQRGSPTQLRNTSASFNISSNEEFISDQRSLTEYLRAYEERESLQGWGDGTEADSGPVWSAAPELARARPQYQLAPVNNPSNKSEEGSPGTQGSPQLWWRLHLDPQHLTQWNLDLRMWIQITILERLVKEMKSIDEALQKHGLGDVKLGQVGLERLNKTAKTAYIAQHVPTLPALLPFLQLTQNQEYLVQRIKELATGGCMSKFKWNSGGSYQDKPWEDSLPTDSEIIMHLFATYMDTQLLPVTQNPDGRPFTSQHFSKTPEKPKRAPGALIIHQATLRPPHYVLIRGEETIEVAKGRNNLIHTLLLFLHTVATERHGMLGRVNLGRSGLNILWVIGR